MAQKPELSPLEQETTGLKLFPLLTLLGWILIVIAIVTWIGVLSPTASSYWGENAKAVRDAAAVGDSLLGDLVTLTSIPKWLAPFTFLGVASFMLGIALEFAAIPGIIQRRTAVLKQAVPLMGGK